MRSRISRHSKTNAVFLENEVLILHDYTEIQYQYIIILPSSYTKYITHKTTLNETILISEKIYTYFEKEILYKSEVRE